MQRTRTASYQFAGGPLDGQVRQKTRRGRWPAGVDADGTTLPPGAVDRYLRNENVGFYANHRPLPTTDGSIVREYRWWAPR